MSKLSSEPLRPLYCPRCDRRFVSLQSMEEAWKTLNEHVNKAHPEYENYKENE